MEMIEILEIFELKDMFDSNLFMNFLTVSSNIFLLVIILILIFKIVNSWLKKDWLKIIVGMMLIISIYGVGIYNEVTGNPEILKEKWIQKNEQIILNDLNNNKTSEMKKYEISGFNFFKEMLYNHMFDLKNNKIILKKLIEDNDNFETFFPNLKKEQYSLLKIDQKILLEMAVFERSGDDKKRILDYLEKQVKSDFQHSPIYLFTLSKDNGDGIICLSVAKNNEILNEKINKMKNIYSQIRNSNSLEKKLTNLTSNNTVKDLIKQNTIRNCQFIKLKSEQEILN